MNICRSSRRVECSWNLWSVAFQDVSARHIPQLSQPVDSRRRAVSVLPVRQGHWVLCQRQRGGVAMSKRSRAWIPQSDAANCITGTKWSFPRYVWDSTQGKPVVYWLSGHDDHTKLYDTLGDFTAEEFTNFIDPSNYCSQLIILHMLILDYVMGSTIFEGRTDRLADARVRNIRSVFEYRKAMLVVWTTKVAANLPPEYRKYADWPVQFTKECVDSNSSPVRIHTWPPTPINLTEEVE